MQTITGRRASTGNSDTSQATTMKRNIGDERKRRRDIGKRRRKHRDLRGRLKRSRGGMMRPRGRMRGREDTARPTGLRSAEARVEAKPPHQNIER